VTVWDDLDLLREMVGNSRGVFAVDRVRERIEQLEAVAETARTLVATDSVSELVEAAALLRRRLGRLAALQDGEQR
jgi:hypothetical protein